MAADSTARIKVLTSSCFSFVFGRVSHTTRKMAPHKGGGRHTKIEPSGMSLEVVAKQG